MKKQVVVLGISTLVLTFSVKGGVATTTPHSQKPVNVDFSLNYSPYYFKWTEKGGVNEKGWLHSLETKANVKINTIAWFPYFEPKFKIYGGEVKYDGETWSGTELKTRTNYNGWNVELDAGYKLNFSGNFKVSFYAGLGYEYWKRSLQNTEIALGYDEKWNQKYIKLGIKPENKIGKLSLYADLYIKYPWEVKNEVSLFDVEVKPEEKINYGVEAGGKMHGLFNKNINLFASGFYEREKFGKSDLKYSPVVDVYLYQPDSKRKTYGLKVGLEF